MASKPKNGKKASPKKALTTSKTKTKAKSKATDRVNCPYCGTPHDVTLDTAKIDCSECGYKITIGKKVLPISNNWYD